MKTFVFRLLSLCFAGLVVFTSLALSACDTGIIADRYSLELPELPPAWDSLLGPPRWKIQWLSREGREETRFAHAGENLEISLPDTWVSAVFAWPFWPEKGINPGLFKPAGGLFPYDLAGDSLSLTWKGGLDAVLYMEMGIASAGEPGSKSSVPRLPRNFNWPRFRELFVDASVNAQFRADPWLADWSSIAAKIWQSGFDKRRLVPLEREEIRIPVAPGPWIGPSPFAAPLLFSGEPTFPVQMPASPGVSGPVDSWVCAEGILRCNSNAWFFLKFE
ncbi:MAG: hypothetical protein LBH43_21395 [Treponema sp.]|jgi:hypothetical protein|nr:hypothetical protein [Treponema sp.]